MMLHPYQLWERLHRLPFGARLYSVLLGVGAPYTGTIGAEVLELAPGFARIRLPDRRRVRNHLRSIHAVALANLGELTGNLALLAALPDPKDMIVTGFSIEYLKKARGELIAECRLEVPKSAPFDIEPLVSIKDALGQEVARARPRCRVRVSA
jgi:acyl-coenzyme A thioesterase PaaI-like protein